MAKALRRWQTGGGQKSADADKLSDLRIRIAFLGLYENHMLPFLNYKTGSIPDSNLTLSLGKNLKFRQECEMNRAHKFYFLEGNT